MEWYFKDRRRCNISEKRIKIYFVKLLLVLVMTFLMSVFFVILIDKKSRSLVNTYIDTEAERLANNLVSEAIHDKLADYDYNLLNVKYEGSKENITYNTSELNKLTNRIVREIQYELDNLDEGKIKESNLLNNTRNKKFKHIKNGIICDLSIGSVRNSLLFANIGPTIPIKLIFLSQINTDIDIKTKEYGINNIIVTINLKVTLQEQITMPITSKRKNIIIEQPLMINIIKGEIPYLYDKRIEE